MMQRYVRYAGRAVITLAGVVVVWLGVTMAFSDALIRPSATEKYLDEGEARIEIQTDRDQHLGLWLMGHAMRLGSAGLLLAFGGLLIVKPWRPAKPSAHSSAQSTDTT